MSLYYHLKRSASVCPLVLGPSIPDDQRGPTLLVSDPLLPHDADATPPRVVADHLAVVVPEYVLWLLQGVHNTGYIH